MFIYFFFVNSNFFQELQILYISGIFLYDHVVFYFAQFLPCRNIKAIGNIFAERCCALAWRQSCVLRYKRSIRVAQSKLLSALFQDRCWPHWKKIIFYPINSFCYLSGILYYVIVSDCAADRLVSGVNLCFPICMNRIPRVFFFSIFCDNILVKYL